MSSFPTSIGIGLQQPTSRSGLEVDPLEVGLGVLRGGLSIASAISGNAALRQRRREITQGAAVTLSQLEANRNERIDDRARRADQIIGTLRAASGAAGIATPAAVQRQVDIDRARGDRRDRQSFENNRLAVITQARQQRNSLGNAIQNPLEIALNGVVAGFA